ncbi:hypothetical protein BAUCODRAFT_107204 [Baudoinia panamericana UAMH 10762]|uniref:Aminotransferase class I/classII large domain-containing protein n=1 Tax=Baudoinia panamericana (strain UAMH 10762) TaxID=717646 RepID=M2NF40_BAUPA|nr:uncharacterized protein BAUCODRAFT_107204 [Baudoinia panamericana UAMH 10762]EMC97585.1 hypothetical protein BAUCODRAFT_107204 [Baudoinia panamericana UAMH 10762]
MATSLPKLTRDAELETLSSRAAENVRDPDHWAPLLKALSNPWSRTNTTGTIILGIAENTLMHQELAEHITSHFTVSPPEHLTYGNGPQGSPRLRKALASFFNARFEPLQQTKAEEFIVTAGVSAVIDELTWCLCSEGEGILFPRPLYTGFRNDLPIRSRGKVVPVSFRREDGGVVLDDLFDAEANLRCLERGLSEAEKEGTKIKAVMITNPHNPLGKCYPPATIKAIASFCAKHNLHYLSDEIYAMSTWRNPNFPDATHFHSVLSVELSHIIRPEMVHVLYGAAKDFCANGLRLGVLHTRSETLRRAMITIATFAWEAYLIQDCWARILEDDKWLKQFLTESQKRLSTNYGTLTSFLDQHSIPYYKGGNAAIFLWVDLRRWKTEDAITEECLKAGVMVAKGTNFVPEELGWFRLTFSTQKEVLEEGLRRLTESLKKFDG